MDFKNFKKISNKFFNPGCLKKNRKNNFNKCSKLAFKVGNEK